MDWVKTQQINYHNDNNHASECTEKNKQPAGKTKWGLEKEKVTEKLSLRKKKCGTN